MITTETLKKNSGLDSTAYFSNGDELTLSVEELCAFHIREGRKYSQEEYEQLILKIMCQRAKSKIMPYVVFTKRTEKQIYDKITENGFSVDVAEVLTEELKEKEYIDDREYSRSYIKKSIAKGLSKQKIIWDLKNKGVSQIIAEEILQEISPDELALAENALNKKLRTGGKKDYNKLYAFLMRKGFTGEIARKVLQESGIERDEKY